ncbi:hypothetical protein L1987_13453 [Smallanthus sonchifolius]|uniref:Uncharacterized protein n=1 Tax=Smallanthus sonchifolius TaxID=185202 RepID=A0ACB9JK23_9ASTR|nr:hypothetical protein L1987_13453 [Smallanthus sonchifolius]
MLLICRIAVSHDPSIFMDFAEVSSKVEVVKVLLEPIITPEILQQNLVKGEYKAKKEIALNRADEDACRNVVVLYASLHQDIQTVINLSGRYKIERGIEERLGKVYLEKKKLALRDLCITYRRSKS